MNFLFFLKQHKTFLIIAISIIVVFLMYSRLKAGCINACDRSMISVFTRQDETKTKKLFSKLLENMDLKVKSVTAEGDIKSVGRISGDKASFGNVTIGASPGEIAAGDNIIIDGQGGSISVKDASGNTTIIPTPAKK